MRAWSRSGTLPKVETFGQPDSFEYMQRLHLTAVNCEQNYIFIGHVVLLFLRLNLSPAHTRYDHF